MLTVAKYMSPKGTSIHGQGLAPTVPVASQDEDEAPRALRTPIESWRRRSRSLKAEVAPAAKAELAQRIRAFSLLPGEKRGHLRAGTFIAAPV